MNTVQLDKCKYDQSWAELNRQLIEIEKSRGLSAALESLWVQQRDQGFIRDGLESLERYNYPHPTDKERFFSVQFNPERSRRLNRRIHNGSSRDSDEVNDGCFLCRDNIYWQQDGIELGYDINVSDTSYVVLMNPYPLMPVHAIVATQEHIPQAWANGKKESSSFDVAHIVSSLIELSTRLPGYIGFYNGVGAGASNPAHFHYQFIRRDAGARFPLELAPRTHSHNSHGVISDYPVTAAFWRSHDAKSIVEDAMEWIDNWLTTIGDAVPAPSANLLASCNLAGETELYFVPRDQRRSHSPEMAGLIGGLEILGELVFSTDDEKRRLESSEIDYQTVERILTSACAKL